MSEPLPYDNLPVDETWAKANNFYGKRLTRIDPETKKPHANSKNIFWEVENVGLSCRAGGDMNNPVIEMTVVPYYKDKTYTTQIPDDNGRVTGTATRHEAVCVRDAQGHLVEPAYKKFEFSTFVKQFVAEL